jgi:hypothetical protein
MIQCKAETFFTFGIMPKRSELIQLNVQRLQKFSFAFLYSILLYFYLSCMSFFFSSSIAIHLDSAGISRKQTVFNMTAVMLTCRVALYAWLFYIISTLSLVPATLVDSLWVTLSCGVMACIACNIVKKVLEVCFNCEKNALPISLLIEF